MIVQLVRARGAGLDCSVSRATHRVGRMVAAACAGDDDEFGVLAKERGGSAR